MKPFVIPIFIAHQGCPHRCVFCDQHTITGNTDGEKQAVTHETVREIIEKWLPRARRGKDSEVQVAFYGGSFTGLPIQRQRKLLGSVAPYIAERRVDCIRISTRPDYIDEARIAVLREYSVAVVELGIQSFAQDVLEASARGHSAAQSEEAVRLLKRNGFRVGVQLMCGLPGDTTAKLMATAERAAGLGPDFARIYPALVIKGSGLERLYRDGRYVPLSLEKAVALCCRMKNIFASHNIRVIRIGLQPSVELEEKIVAGPYHPAFGELVISRALYKQTRNILRKKAAGSPKYLSIAAADESVFRGRKNLSIRKLSGLGLLENVELIFDRDQPRNSVLMF